MSDTWNEGYFTDAGYTFGYYREISPVFLRFCLLLRGLACDDPGEDAAHCELGFGQGVSVNIHAAANPGRYVATDFNPAPAANARNLASRAGSDIHLYDDSFSQLLARDGLPTFDTISLHGIWAWVSQDNRQVITDFVARHLKPGGLFYISYNCFPGWSAAYPLRQLFALHDRYASVSPGAVQRVEAALKFTQALLAAGPLYARATPGIEDRLKTITGQDRHYVAHEYLNREWNCMYFTDVADAMAAARLEFATTAVPLDGVDGVNVTPEGMAFLNGIEHPILREQIRDYFVNQQFRRDIFQRGVRRLSPAEQREQMLTTRIILLQRADLVPMKINGATGEATLQEDVYRPLLNALAARDYAPKSLHDLVQAVPALSLPQLVQASAVLVGAGHAAPCQAEPAVSSVRERCTALNRHLLERARINSDINWLASPVTGGGVVVGRFQQLFLLARSQGHDRPDEWAKFVWHLLDDQGQKLIKDGTVLETPEENLAELATQAHSFAEERIPILKALHMMVA